MEMEASNGIMYIYENQPKAVKSQYNEDVYNNKRSSLNIHKNLSYNRSSIRLAGDGGSYPDQKPGVGKKRVLNPIALQKRRAAQVMAAAMEHKRCQDHMRSQNSPLPVIGRCNVHVQTELYLEELCDRVEENDTYTQTDQMLARPIAPLILHLAKTGVDQETQVEEGELFDFDREVQPVLEVLVCRTLEQAFCEVMEEEELANIRQQQRQFEEIRNADTIEIQRIEAKVARASEEKAARNEETRERMRVEQETIAKLAARSFAHRYMEELEPAVFGRLNAFGFMFDPISRDVEMGFMKELHRDVNKDAIQHQLSRAILDNIIMEVVLGRKTVYGGMNRDLAELKQVASLIPRLMDESYYLTVDDMANLAEHMLHLAGRATDAVGERVARDVLQIAVDQYALEEAAAQTAIQAAEDAEEDEY